MEDLSANPVLGAAILPAIVAFLFATALARTRWLGLAQAAGFIASASLVVGWATEPLTVTRKLAFAGACVALLCIVFEFFAARRRAPAAEAAIVAGLAAVWMLWRLLVQKDAGAATLAGLLAGAYVALQVFVTLSASADPVRGAAAGAVLGWAGGVLCIFGASALLGILSLATGTAAAATLFVQAARNSNARPGMSISLPASAVAGLAGVAAVETAELSAWVLIPLLAVAPVTRFIPARRSPRVRAVVAFIVGAAPALVAIAIAWFRWA